MTQPHGNSFRRYLAVSFFQFTKLLAKYVSYVPSQMHRPLRDGLENTCIPNESCGDRKRLGHRAMTVLNTSPDRPDDLARPFEAENHFRPARAKLHDFRAARG